MAALALSMSAGCLAETMPDEPVPSGVVFTYPIDGQRDVPVGARILVSFSDAVADEAAGAVRIVGPDGPVAPMPIDVNVEGRGKTLAITSKAFAPGTTYELYAGASPGGEAGEGPNDDPSAPLLRFTTRSDRPLAGAPALIALNGSDPASPGALRPMFETSTLALVFSEPLDPRRTRLAPGAIELVDVAAATPVPATIVASGIHVAIDPHEPLTPGASYELRLGDAVADLAGETATPTVVSFVPIDSTGAAPIRQVFRTRQAADPEAAVARIDAPNQMAVAHPMIGEAIASVLPGVLETELGDPQALGGPIAFRIPRGQRLASQGLEVALAGVIPSGLATGDIWIELLTDGGGRIYRNPHRAPETLPDNDASPLLVDLSFDLAVYASDATGNAVLSQSILGVQLAGFAIADDGALSIETLGALDIDLLGVGSAATNIVLDLVSDPGAVVVRDERAPTLLGSLPARDTRDWVTDEGLELVFDEPIDVERARAGGIVIRDTAGTDVAVTIENHGAMVVVRPVAPLVAGRAYRVSLLDVADVAGNAMAPQFFHVGTQPMATTDIPPSVVAVYPGAPCSLVDANATSSGRCAGGAAGDDTYRPFALAAGERIAVTFDQPVSPASITLGAACNTGSVRVERVDELGACQGVVPGSLRMHQRDLAFVPYGGWTAGARYQLRLVSGPNGTCTAGEVCGANGKPASFDRLAGTTEAAGGGPDLVIRFVGEAPTTATTLFVSTGPAADINGSGKIDPGEPRPDENRVALRIAGTSGLIDNARFEGGDCVLSTPEPEACMYVNGAIPAQLGERRDNCTLPDGTMVATCIPVRMSAQAMYSTSVTMVAGALGIGLTTDTGMSIMRLREGDDGPLEGFIVSRGGKPMLVAALELYMDAPDMSLPLVQHDMKSKPLSIALEGPLRFGADGRIAIALRNTADVPISVGINAPLGLQGSVNLIVPAGEMRLQLVSPSRRGRLP
ncbi:MAG TPA: Ig-like domain-containing protein [Kofleriaceae bacterium]|nr:Ig-like domain-containing protein [Kofleriaceae bacterium]